MLTFWTIIYWNTLRTCLKISSSSRLLRSSSCLLPLSLASRIRLCRSASMAKAWMRLSSYNLEICNTRFIQAKSKRKHVCRGLRMLNLIRGFPGIELKMYVVMFAGEVTSCLAIQFPITNAVLNNNNVFSNPTNCGLKNFFIFAKFFYFLERNPGKVINLKRLLPKDNCDLLLRKSKTK